MLDVIIKNGKIVDGTGNPWYFGDVGLKGGTIVEVGKIDQEADNVIDAQRQVVAPGFIDGHCHSDLMILDHPLSEIKLQQGVTTEVVGNCGLAPAPFLPQHAELLQTYVEPVLGKTTWKWPWETIEEYMHTVSNHHPSGNISTYVAHGALRIAVMGFDNRPATARELQQMKDLLEEGMKAGAIGLSIGLLYAPGSYTAKEEIAELCGVIAKYNGLFSTHIRGEGNNLLPSIEEVIWIAEKSGVSLHVSHLKAAGKSNWGKIQQALGMIEDARARGIDVTCDVYPYTAGSTMLSTVFPPWVLEGGIKHTLERLGDGDIRANMKSELNSESTEWDNLVYSTGWDSVYISSVNSDENKGLEGKHILEISQSRGVDPVDCALDLFVEEGGNVSIVFFHMSDKDVNQVMAWDGSLIASDSLHCQTGKPHPRLFGTFPRVFSKYVREDRTLSLEEAVRKVTSYPAQRFKLGKRGMLVPGYAADLVVFDPETISDTATYQAPKQFPEGISHVVVGGTKTIEHRKHLQAQEGQVIHHHIRCPHHL